MKNAQDSLRWTHLTAPDDGVVTGVSAAAGQVVSAGQTVFTVATGTGRDVVFDVATPETLDRRATARFRVALLQNPSVMAEAHLRDISPQADAQTRSWRVRITLDNPPPEMVLGASVAVTLPLADTTVDAVMAIPATALTRQAGQPAVFILDPVKNCVIRRTVAIAGYTADAVWIRAGIMPGDRVITAGVRSLRDGERVAGSGRISMKPAFNLSAWALKQQLMAFLMLLIVAAGIVSYEKLSRNEDPAFTIKTAVVSAQWPSADINDTVRLVTDTLEKKLQEIPWLDYVQSETHAGRTVIFVNLHDDTPPAQVAGIWYQVRKKNAGCDPDLAAGRAGPGGQR